MEYKLVISKKAEKDILSICDYIAKDCMQSANKVATRIYETIENIGRFPKMGGSTAERFEIESDYQYFPVLPYPYLIFYKTIKDKVNIGRVIDGRRDCIRVLVTSR